MHSEVGIKISLIYCTETQVWFFSVSCHYMHTAYHAYLMSLSSVWLQCGLWSHSTTKSGNGHMPQCVCVSWLPACWSCPRSWYLWSQILQRKTCRVWNKRGVLHFSGNDLEMVQATRLITNRISHTANCMVPSAGAYVQSPSSTVIHVMAFVTTEH